MLCTAFSLAMTFTFIILWVVAMVKLINWVKEQ